VGYNPHERGAASYHSLLAFCAETKEILQGWHRTGNAYTSNAVDEFMRQLLTHLPNRIRILFRCYSGFFVGNLMDLLDDLGRDYIIKAKFNGLKSMLETKVWTKINLYIEFSSQPQSIFEF
jgi:hypothetical protein